MEKGLVSIMIPCYNGAPFLDRLFQTFLRQTYRKFQIIFVNDGSMDETDKIAKKYISVFHEENIKFEYVVQENKGQAAAINTALSYVQGEYCMWFDVDDFMSENHLQRKVEYLESHQEHSVVMCKGFMVDENDIYTTIGTLGDENAIGSLFEDVLFEYRRCTPGLYMVRTNRLMECLVNQKIYVSEVGQNLQLLLPILFENKVGFIDEFLFYYVVRKGSHSHSVNTGRIWKERLEKIEDVKDKTLCNIGMTVRERECLYEKLNLFSIIQRLEKVDDVFLKNECGYLQGLIEEFLKCSNVDTYIKNRGIYIWGDCAVTKVLIRGIEQYSSYRVTGVIDSDILKCGMLCEGKEIIYANDIEKRDMYIIIPINTHKSIEMVLKEKNFLLGEDYFYPRLELKRAVEKN